MDINELSIRSGVGIGRIRTLLRGGSFPDDCIALRPGKGKAIVFNEKAIAFVKVGLLHKHKHKLSTTTEATKHKSITKVKYKQLAQVSHNHKSDEWLILIEQKLDRIEQNQNLLLTLLQAQTGAGMQILMQAVDVDKLKGLL